MRLAWFSPFPPVKTGVAAVSAPLVATLRSRGHVVDPYPEHAAHDFVWRRRQDPYDLAVYQFGNSSHHDYEWAYALNYPGLVVLHDTHLHHARAAFLLRERRPEDYRAEFAWNHPGASRDLAELGVAGFDSALYYDWPMMRALVVSARLVAVHGNAARTELLEQLASGRPSAADRPPDNVRAIRLSLGTQLGRDRIGQARRSIRSRYGIGEDAIVFGCFGGLTPEKRLPQILSAFKAVVPYAPSSRLLFGGAPAAHYDLRADIAAQGLEDRATITGYLERDEDLADHIAACDATLNLRWPTARETSGPWLQALAAGRPTVITDLVHLSDVPSLDPRSWTVNGSGTTRDTAVCIAIDLMDEDHSLRLAMRRLAADAGLRDSLGRRAQAWWTRHHSPEGMADDYESVLGQAAQRSDPHVELPTHMRNRGDRTLQSLLAPFGVRNPIASDTRARHPGGTIGA